MVLKMLLFKERMISVVGKVLNNFTNFIWEQVGNGERENTRNHIMRINKKPNLHTAQKTRPSVKRVWTKLNKSVHSVYICSAVCTALYNWTLSGASLTSVLSMKPI